MRQREGNGFDLKAALKSETSIFHLDAAKRFTPTLDLAVNQMLNEIIHF